MCQDNWYHHTCQHTTFVGTHPCLRFRLSGIFCIPQPTTTTRTGPPITKNPFYLTSESAGTVNPSDILFSANEVNPRIFKNPVIRTTELASFYRPGASTVHPSHVLLSNHKVGPRITKNPVPSTSELASTFQPCQSPGQASPMLFSKHELSPGSTGSTLEQWIAAANHRNTICSAQEGERSEVRPLPTKGALGEGRNTNKVVQVDRRCRMCARDALRSGKWNVTVEQIHALRWEREWSSRMSILVSLKDDLWKRVQEGGFAGTGLGKEAEVEVLGEVRTVGPSEEVREMETTTGEVSEQGEVEAVQEDMVMFAVNERTNASNGTENPVISMVRKEGQGQVQKEVSSKLTVGMGTNTPHGTKNPTISMARKEIQGQVPKEATPNLTMGKATNPTKTSGDPSISVVRKQGQGQALKEAVPNLSMCKATNPSKPSGNPSISVVRDVASPSTISKNTGISPANGSVRKVFTGSKTFALLGPMAGLKRKRFELTQDQAGRAKVIRLD